MNWKARENKEVLAEIQSSDYRMVRCKVRLNLKREGEKLARLKEPPCELGRARMQEFQTPLQNEFPVLTDANEDGADTPNGNTTYQPQSQTLQ